CHYALENGIPAQDREFLPHERSLGALWQITALPDSVHNDGESLAATFELHLQALPGHCYALHLIPAVPRTPELDSGAGSGPLQAFFEPCTHVESRCRRLRSRKLNRDLHNCRQLRRINPIL